MVEQLDKLILVNKSEEAWKYLTEHSRPRVVGEFSNIKPFEEVQSVFGNFSYESKAI